MKEEERKQEIARKKAEEEQRIAEIKRQEEEKRQAAIRRAQEEAEARRVAAEAEAARKADAALDRRLIATMNDRTETPAARAIAAIALGKDPSSIGLANLDGPNSTRLSVPAVKDREFAKLAFGKIKSSASSPERTLDDQLRATMNDPNETLTIRQIAAIALGNSPAKLGLTATPVRPNDVPMPKNPPSIQSPAAYTFAPTAYGTVQISQNGKIIATVTPQLAKQQYSYNPSTSAAPPASASVALAADSNGQTAAPVTPILPKPSSTSALQLGPPGAASSTTQRPPPSALVGNPVSLGKSEGGLAPVQLNANVKNDIVTLSPADAPKTTQSSIQEVNSVQIGLFTTPHPIVFTSSTNPNAISPIQVSTEFNQFKPEAGAKLSVGGLTGQAGVSFTAMRTQITYKKFSETMILGESQLGVSGTLSPKEISAHAGADVTLAEADLAYRIRVLNYDVELVGKPGIGAGAHADFVIEPTEVKIDLKAALAASVGTEINIIKD